MIPDPAPNPKLMWKNCLPFCELTTVSLWNYLNFVRFSLSKTNHGHPQYNSPLLQYCGQPNWLRKLAYKKLRNCHCGPSEWFQGIPNHHLSYFLNITYLGRNSSIMKFILSRYYCHIWKDCLSVNLKLQTAKKNAIAELQLRRNIFLSCGILNTEVIPYSCEIAIADINVSPAHICALLNLYRMYRYQWAVW